MMHLRYIGQLEAYIEEDHAGQRHTITAILPREEVEELYRRLTMPDVEKLADRLSALIAHFGTIPYRDVAGLRFQPGHHRFDDLVAVRNELRQSPPKEPQP